MYYDPRRNNRGLSHNPMTALVVPRPIGWISTVSRDGVVNLTPYSFFNVVSGAPPFIMFASKPRKDSQRDAEETGEFVAMATYDLREAVNASSAEYGPAISEPDRIRLEMAPCREVKPPAGGALAGGVGMQVFQDSRTRQRGRHAQYLFGHFRRGGPHPHRGFGDRQRSYRCDADAAAGAAGLHGLLRGERAVRYQRPPVPDPEGSAEEAAPAKVG